MNSSQDNHDPRDYERGTDMDKNEQQHQQEEAERMRRIRQATRDFLERNAGNGRLPHRTTKSGRFGSPETSTGQASGENRRSPLENVDKRRSDRPKHTTLSDIQ